MLTLCEQIKTKELELIRLRNMQKGSIDMVDSLRMAILNCGGGAKLQNEALTMTVQELCDELGTNGVRFMYCERV